MNYLWEGIKVGLILSSMIGPIFFALVQTSVEEGFRAGAMLGLGIWISDLIFISGVYFALSFVSKLVNTDYFALYLGWGGSITLFIFGLGILLTSPRPNWQANASRFSSYWTLWLKGFLVNTINPFTFFFWLGLSTTVVIQGQLNPSQVIQYFAGILGTIIVTDTVKVALAKKIRTYMRPIHLLWLRRISGVALIVFAVALLIRVIWFL
ncbi:MAG TPA: LysE family translocator [Saprospiraceae bacterium]|nr:LysE family translocator [Saprospiraceae bacterium]HMQ81642.1 LysE family translocator [Saprospiraceae bacterium]